MESRSVAIAPLSGLGADGALDHPASLPTGGRPLGGQGRLFTITDLRVHHADLGVHDGPIPMFTLRRSGCSRWTDLGVHHGPKPAPVTEGGGETLNIRVKPLGAGGREVGHTPMLPAYPMTSLVFMTQ